MKKKTNSNRIITSLKSVLKHNDQQKKICFFLGAGVEISSGGKSFRKLKFDFVNKFEDCVSENISDEMLDIKFNKLLNNIGDVEKTQLLDEIAYDKLNITDGYKLMTLLAEKNYIQAVITTNFFDLLEKTLKEVNLSPFDIISPGYVLPENYYKVTDNYKPMYLKLHGNTNTRLITHISSEEIQNCEYNENIKELVKFILKNYKLVFIGYSGFDDKLTSLIESTRHKLDVYWINVSEPNEDSKLVKLLSSSTNHILEYSEESFDNFILKYACEFFENDTLPDANPIFILSFLKAISQKQNEKFIDDYKLIFERDIYCNLIDTLFNVDNTCILLYGKKGCGKTCILKYAVKHFKDFVIAIDVAGIENNSILKLLANALGYKTDVPFSLLYSFCKWCDDVNLVAVFIVDSISQFCENGNISKYHIELFNFINAVSSFKKVKFILSFDNKNIPKKALNLFNIKNIFEVQCYSQNEICKYFNLMNIESNILYDSYQNLISKPYLCTLFCRCIEENTKKHDSMPTDFWVMLNELIMSGMNSKQGISSTIIEHTIFCIANNEISKEQKKRHDLNEKCLCHLESYEILTYDQDVPLFKFDDLKTFYISKLIYQNETSLNKHIKDLYIFLREIHDMPNIVYDAHFYIFSKVGTIIDTEKKILFLNETFRSCGSTIRTIGFVKKAIAMIIDVDLDNFTKVIIESEFENYEQNFQKCLFSMIQRIKCNDKAYSILQVFSKLKKFELSAFVLEGDRFHNFLKNCTDVNQIIKNQNVYAPSNFIGFFKILYQFMLIETNSKNYDNISKVLFLRLKEIKKHIRISHNLNLKNKIVNDIIPIFKKYSYNILFNSSETIEEDFSAIAHDKCLIDICRKVYNGVPISLNNLNIIVKKSMNIDNMWSFLILNIVIILSMKKDNIATLSIMKQAVENFNDDIQVQQLDFFLSSAFMALFEMQDNGRDEFVRLFKIICEKFQIKLFEQPKEKRKSSAKRFCDEFNLTFEDGFNPIAFYFYTAPSEKQYNSLPIYHELAKTLEETGNESKILKIVHALGQMISIYPKEGFDELEKIIDNYRHPIIKKGLIRILKENIIRYPFETENFITKKTQYFSDGEKFDVLNSLNANIENRAFEQLYWSRLFLTLNLNNEDFLNKFMKAIIDSNSLSDFIAEIFVENNT